MRKALILSFSQVDKDPRILRQIRWLRQLGFEKIEVVGSGSVPIGATKFYPVQVRKTANRYFGYLIRSKWRRFNYFYGEALRLAGSQLAAPDLLVVNEPELLAWPWLYLDKIIDVPTYLDLHEDHVNKAHSNLLERVAFKSYWEWQTGKLLKFSSSRTGGLFVTSVEDEIASEYSSYLLRPVGVILNAPDFFQIEGSAVDEGRIGLVHHGIGTKNRGIETCIKAMKYLPRNYHLTLILIQSPSYRAKIEIISRLLGVRSRLTIKPGVSLSQLPYELREHDLALVLQSDATPNHLNSLPNKLFESIQGRLGVICGPNPAIRKIVQENSLGVAMKTWSRRDLVATILSLGPDQISGFKVSSALAARKLSSEAGARTFSLGVENIL